MPDPKSFKNKDTWMGSCLTQLKEEGKPHDQSVAICLSMWENKDKKRTKKVAVYDFIRDLATSTIYRYSEESEDEQKPTQPFVKGFFDKNIADATVANDNFRKVLYTGNNSQLVLMSLKPGEDIGEEVHDVDQFFRIEQGEGEVVINDATYDLKDDASIIVPAGAKHNFINTGKEDLKIYTVYSPPHHEDGTIHKTKEEALKSEEHFDGKTTENMVKTAKIGEKYSYASTQVDIPDYLAKEIMAWGKENIAKEDITDKGFEDEIHATILYGLKDDNPGGVRRLTRHFRPFEVRLGVITAFNTPEFDVIKIAVESPVLSNMHYFLEKNLDNTNTFPTFQPHVTIAYLKKGTASKYIGCDVFSGQRFTAEDIVFSSKDNKKISISLK